MSLTRIILNGAIIATGIAGTAYNANLREEVQKGATAWQQHMGYLSDFFVPLAIVSAVGVYASVINHFKRKRYDFLGRKQLENSLDNLVLGSALFTASTFSVIEQINNFGNKATSGDWNYIYSYFGGAGLAYITYNLSSVLEKGFKWEK